MKPRLTVRQAHFLCAVYIIRDMGLEDPTHCTVRSYMNDINDAHKKGRGAFLPITLEGVEHLVCEGYSQDRAHEEVGKLIRAQRHITSFPTLMEKQLAGILTAEPRSEFRMAPSDACWGGEVSEQEWMDINKGE